MTGDGWCWRRDNLGNPKLPVREWSAPAEGASQVVADWSRAYRRGRPLAARARVCVQRRAHVVSGADLTESLTITEERVDDGRVGAWTPRLRRLALAEFRATHAGVGLRVLQPAGLHELVEGKVDLLISRGLGHHPGYRCDRVNEGSGLGDWLIAPAGTADCPEIVSFRDWLRRLQAENPAAMHRRHALVNVSQG